MADEEFGHIRIDEAAEDTGWTGDVPYLDYWRVRLDHSKLSDAQRQFYKYVKESVLKGVKIRDYNINQYLLILRDELVRDSLKMKNRRSTIRTIKMLYHLYGFHDYTLDEVLKKEAVYQREHRIRQYKKDAPARWIAPGETVVVDGMELKRGGFYLGKYLRFSKFHLQDHNFYKSATSVEGPVVNLSKDSEIVDKSLTRRFTTFVEMSDELQDAIIDWLKGEETDNVQVLLYYLSGIEMRLLGDADATDEERAQLIKYLYELLVSQSVKLISRRYNIGQSIIDLIDFALARYFTDTAEQIIPPQGLVYAPMLQRARIAKALSAAESASLSNNAITDIVVNNVMVPEALPDVFREAFLNRLKTKYQESLMTYSAWVPPNMYRYGPIGTDNGYAPSPEISDGLMREGVFISTNMMKFVNKAMSTLNTILGELSSFLQAIRSGASPLRLARLLPRWCDSRLLDGVDETVAKIKPADGEKFRIIELGALLNAIGVKHEDKLDANDMNSLNLELYRFGLRVSTSAIRGTKLGLDEVVAVYDNRYGDATTRGTLLISLFLLAWVIGADGPKERDIKIVDDWLTGLSDNPDQMVPAMGAFIWLVNRKLTLSVKRKVRAKQLAKFSKKRDEFIKVLLTVISDPESASAKRMARVQTIYDLVGLNSDDIHSDLHRMATSSVVTPRKVGSASSNTLDKAKLKEMAQSTERAQQILATVFVDEPNEEAKAKKAEKPKGGKGKVENPTLEVLGLLIKKSEWPRDEFEKICKKYGETVGSMLERLNDYSYEHVDEAVAEDDDDTVYIDTEVAKLMTNDE